MNVKEKFVCITGALVGFASFLLGFLLSSRRNRPTSRTAGEQLDEAGRTVAELEEGLTDNRRIIEEIRKHKVEK